MSVRLLVSVKTKNKWRPALKITQTDKTSLVIRVTLNSTYFERLTWPCSFHGCESRNHKQNLNCSQNWYKVTTNQFSYHLRKPVIVKNKQLPPSHCISCFMIICLSASLCVLIWVPSVHKLSFWCVCNELFLITTFVLYWFYFIISEFLTVHCIRVRSKEDPQQLWDRWATRCWCSQSPWLSLTLEFGDTTLLDLSSVLLIFRTVQHYCAYLHGVCWSFLISHSILFKRKENHDFSVLENQVPQSQKVLGNLKKKKKNRFQLV